VPNFAALPAAGPPSDRTREHPCGPWLFAGRLTAEKGVLELLARWPAGEPLDIVGDGELHAEARAAAPAGVRFLGPLDRNELRRRLPDWRGLVFPSRCFEGAPLIHVEALAAGLPVLAFAGSSVAEAVRAHGTGTVVDWHEPLLPALHRADATFPTLRAHCRRVFAAHFTETAWLDAIRRLYGEVIHQVIHAEAASAAVLPPAVTR
ncbi:MAG: glycosyltransferase, partial [Streptomycetaceae bacterium]|nr:glycosyltransferase [Streptomycetaceae bacterium]